MRKKRLFFAFAGMFFLLSACNEKKQEKNLNVPEKIPVTIISLVKKNNQTITTGTGLLTTDEETLLSFKNGGIIERIYVKEGDFVKKGQLLATLNTTELKAKTEKVKAAKEKAVRDFQRAEKLYKDSVATLEQFQNAQTALDVIEQDWKTILFNLEQSEIRAQFDGHILMKLQNEGQIVGPGMPVFRINSTGTGNWIVKTGVSDRNWANINIGDSALIETDAFSHKITAKVVRKSEGIDPESGTFTIFVKPNNPPKQNIASGMFAKVKIFGNPKKAWRIPYSALLDAGNKKGVVYLTNDKETVIRKEITFTSLYDDFVLVKEGLENYKYLILSGSPYLKENAKIIVNE